MSDNVDIFKKVIFSIPSLKELSVGITVLGFIYSALFYLSLDTFTSLQIKAIIIPFIAVFFFIGPAFLSGELLYRLLPDYPREWGYFLALCNQLLIFIYSLILTGANNFVNAWNILWLGLITLYLSNFFVLLLTIGYEHVRRIGLLSLAQPVIILAGFHLFLGSLMHIPLYLYAMNALFFIVATFILIVSFGIFEYLMGANVANVSVLKLTSGLLQKKQEALDLGYPSQPDVQTLEIENESGRTQVSIPWIHPGPLEGFGGGNITGDIIEDLNKNGSGFFLHVPSTHKADPADPDDYKKILDAMATPGKIGEASRLVNKSYGNLRFYGRKINGKKIVYLDARDYGDYDDYEISIFREVIDPEETIIIDLHNHEKTTSASEREEVHYNTEVADNLRSGFEDFLKFLDKQETSDYSAGFKSEVDGTPVFALHEEVAGQETLLFGIEGNEASPELLELEEEYKQHFDEVLLFTTDTHNSIHELSSKQQVEPSRVDQAVEEAVRSSSPASIGFTNRKAETMNLLREDYSGLVFSINILVRLIPLTLLLFYLILVVWVF